MNFLTLSLRQRKLLHYIQHQNTYITGEILANHLQVSPRTIRNDVNELNKKLEDWNIQITSKRSRGYMLAAGNQESLEKLNKASNSFLFRDDRIRHIAFLLCLTDTPISLYDLEEEMFISRTTLEHDLNELRKKYVLPYPHIDFSRSKNNISFGSDERKKRAVLNRLFTENWDYNGRGNAYYKYQYLEEEIVNLIMSEVNKYMRQYDIFMDDINMVILTLSIAIMFYRINSGHELTSSPAKTYQDFTAVHAASELLDSLEVKLSCTFSEIERNEIYLLISCSRLLDAPKLNYTTVGNYFEPEIIEIADKYIAKVYDSFHLNLSDNEDFYITLLQYLRYLSLPIHYFNNIQTHLDVTRENLLISLEIAYLIQPFSLDFYGYYLDYTELLYLAFCISGALAFTNRTAPKLKSVIMCHLNLYSSWNIKQKILTEFDDYIDLTALLPVYAKDNFDFSKIDLIISTANKKIIDSSICQTLVISPFFTHADQITLQKYIAGRQFDRLHSTSLPSVLSLLKDGFWHERLTFNDNISIIELLANDFISRGYVSPDYLSDILRRESILTFAAQPGIVLMHSQIPSSRTCLSIVTLEHRIKWNSYKIRTVILLALKPEDASLILQLINKLYYENNPEDARFLKTPAEIIDFFSDSD